MNDKTTPLVPVRMVNEYVLYKLLIRDGELFQLKNIHDIEH